MRYYRFFLLLLILPLTSTQALDIRVTSGDWQPINLTIDRFENELELSYPLSDVIANDLSVSGYFRTDQKEFHHVQEDSDLLLSQLQAEGSEYFLTGRVFSPPGKKEKALEFFFYDALGKKLLGNYRISFTPEQARLAAHQVSNWIYEKIISKQGVFHTKVVYILRHENGQNEIKISDYDGYNRFTVLKSEENLISPTWTPDGNGILYVSFERNKPIVYQQSLLTGERSIIANFKGSNSAPAAAPDHRTIAVALTEHGGVQQIYLLSGSRKTRMRESYGINTEPTFSPNSKKVAYVSDEGGSPQIYEYDTEKGENQRLSFGSRYNVSPDYSSDGGVIVFIRRKQGGGNNIALLDIGSKKSFFLTDIRLADSPSFSPNDDIVLFKDESRKNYLSTVSTEGKILKYWDKPENGVIIDPSWSPIRSDWF